MPKPVITGYSIVVTGELLASLLNLPKRTKIVKVVPSEHRSYTFNVLVFDPKGYEIPEGGDFPIKENK